MHEHEHTHDQEHSHESDSYYLDQLCMVALSAAYGAVCLGLYFWKTDMLTRLLGQQFHLFVAISGFTLVGLAILRAVSLWVRVGKAKAAVAHTHDHEHDEHCHDHGEDCGHDHAHAHAHDHSHEDHDHSWAPWRYVVLLVPVIFFLLGLPNKGPKAIAANSTFAVTDLATEAMGLVSPSSPGWSQLIYVGYLGKDQAKGNAEDWDFRNLSPAVSAAANSPDPYVRDQWKNKKISVIGMYSPTNQSDREFRLVRFKLTCCVADAVQLNLPILSRESIRNIKANSWVRVTGHVEFRKRLDEVIPVIVVAGSQDVQPCAEDPNPYN